MSGEPDDYYWLYEDPIWKVAEIDQLQAKARESNRKAIRMCLIGRWIYASVFVLDLIIFVTSAITGTFAWFALVAMVTVASIAYGNERMLRSSRRRSP